MIVNGEHKAGADAHADMLRDLYGSASAALKVLHAARWTTPETEEVAQLQSVIGGTREAARARIKSYRENVLLALEVGSIWEKSS